MAAKHCGGCFFYPHENSGYVPSVGKCRLLGKHKFDYEGMHCRSFSEWTIEKHRMTYL